MTKKARRRQIMEEVGYPDKRVEYHGETMTYIRGGELLKEELKHVLQALDAWHDFYETQTKGAWRSHIRRAIDMDKGYDRFTLHELTQIWRAVQEQ